MRPHNYGETMEGAEPTSPSLTDSLPSVTLSMWVGTDAAHPTGGAARHLPIVLVIRVSTMESITVIN